MQISERAVARNQEWRVAKITEVNPSSMHFAAEDQYGTPILLTLMGGIIQEIPTVGEQWYVSRQGSDWRLENRLELPDTRLPITSMKPGDARVEASGDISLLPGGIITAPTPPIGDNSTRLATTAFVKGQGYVTAATSPITSVFGRTGVVVAASGDYTAAQITNAADKASGVTQAFSADVSSTGQFIASGGYGFRSDIANISSWAHVVTVQSTTGNAIFGIFGQTLYWADPGGASAVDTSLYRNAANQLRTGGYFQADSAIMATGGNSVIGTGAVLQGNNTYNAGNGWMSGMVGSGIYYDGANWQNKTFGGNNGWAVIGVRGASNPGGIDLYGVNATGASDRSYTPAQFIAQKFGSWTTDGTLTTLGRVISGVPGTGGMWVDGGTNQFMGSYDANNIGLYSGGQWRLLIGNTGVINLTGSGTNFDTQITPHKVEPGSFGFDGANGWGVLYLGSTAGGYLRPMGTGLRIADGGSGSVAQIGFFGATPIARPTAGGVTVNTRGVGTTWLIDNTTTGNVGATAYTIQDIVAALKNLGLITA